MIKAETARANIINYEAEFDAKVKEQVLIVLEEMSASIEYHSKTGIDMIEFTPYNKSRFSSFCALERATIYFDSILKENGYEVVVNDCVKNILKVRW